MHIYFHPQGAVYYTIPFANKAEAWDFKDKRDLNFDRSTLFGSIEEQLTTDTWQLLKKDQIWGTSENTLEIINLNNNLKQITYQYLLDDPKYPTSLHIQGSIGFFIKSLSNSGYHLKQDDLNSKNIGNSGCEHDWKDSRKQGTTKWCTKCGVYE